MWQSACTQMLSTTHSCDALFQNNRLFFILVRSLKQNLLIIRLNPILCFNLNVLVVFIINHLRIEIYIVFFFILLFLIFFCVFFYIILKINFILLFLNFESIILAILICFFDFTRWIKICIFFRVPKTDFLISGFNCSMFSTCLTTSFFFLICK